MLQPVPYPSPMAQTRQRGENMRVRAYEDAVAAVAANPGQRGAIIEQEIAKAKNLSAKSADTFGSELFSVTHPYIVPIFGIILEFSNLVQNYPRHATVRRQHALTQEVIRLTRTIIGDYGAKNSHDALQRAKERFEKFGDYDIDGYGQRGRPGRGWRSRL